MIKLVVSDIDGTLLQKGEEFLSDEIKRNIENIKEKGIVFAVASGRNYKELYKICGEMRDIYYICSDGSAIIYNDNIIYKKIITKESLIAFKENKDAYFHTPLNFTTDIKQDIIKICVKSNYFYENPRGTYEVYRDKDYREWIKNNSGKGQAVKYLQRIKVIKSQETAVIGDNYNDVGMFMKASNKYAVKNSPYNIRVIGNKLVDTGNDALIDILNKS